MPNFGVMACVGPAAGRRTYTHTYIHTHFHLYIGDYFDSVFLLSTSKFVKRPSEVKRVLFVLGRQLVLHFSGVRSNRHDEDREVEVRKGKEEAGSDPGNIFFHFIQHFFNPNMFDFFWAMFDGLILNI